MLTELGLRNFKAFGDEMQRAPLAPITLIYGPNSGGKSSIIQALLMLKQSIEAYREWHPALQLMTSGNLVNLGNYASLIHMHDTSRDIEIDVTYEVKKVAGLINHLYLRRGMVGGWISREAKANPEFWIRGNVGLVFTSGNSPVDEVHYGLETSLNNGYTMELVRASNSEPYLGDYGVFEASRGSYAAYLRSVADYGDAAVRGETHPRPLFRGIADNEALRDMADNTENYMQIASVTEDAHSGLPDSLYPSNASIDEPGTILNTYIDNLQYLGPLRATPKRYYDSSEHPGYDYGVIEVGTRGENVPFALANFPALKESVNEWMKRFEIPYTIEVAVFSNNEVIGNELVSMYLTHKHWGSDKRQEILEANHPYTTVTLADVGFGINQMLPLILQGVISSNDIICVEQPEIHLHPRLQAHIADLLIDTVQSPLEHSAPGTGNQWIVETHSEMLVRRLQRRIREGKISNNDVSVLYVDPQDDGSSTIQRLELDEDGRFIDEWPHGFFDEGYRDIMGY